MSTKALGYFFVNTFPDRSESASAKHRHLREFAFFRRARFGAGRWKKGGAQ
jgi:hypothetical protein